MASVDELQARATSANTRQAYAGDWRQFAAWCDARDLAPELASANDVAAWVTELFNAGRAGTTITRKVAALSVRFRELVSDSPTDSPAVRMALRGAVRSAPPPRKAPPLLVPHLRAMCDAMPPTLLAARDRALLLLGWATALRRSELVALDDNDVELVTEGAIVTVRRSKTDQTGAGHTIGVPYGGPLCPVKALLHWQARGVRLSDDGALFYSVRWPNRRLNDKAVDRIVKRRASDAGLSLAFSAHSLRHGLATAASRAGRDPLSIQRQTRHASMATVARYVSTGNLFTNNAVEGLL